MTNAHRKVNALDKIKINGVRLTEKQEVREGIANAYQQLLSESLEIHAALMGMNGDKAPGPDGFMVAFWQSCWETVKEDKGGAEDMGDYRPISLLGGLYKLLAKVLANRLKKVIGNVVSSDQNAFIKGRQILDASLIANEHQLAIFVKGHAKDGIWAKMVGMDVELHIHHQVLSVGERCASWVFLKFERVASRGPSFPYLFVMGMEVLTASGLKINLDKSEVIPVGEVEGVNEMAAEIGANGGKKAHLVKWEVVCADKEKEGLGLRKLACLNKALLGKWIWRFARAKEDLWKKVLEAKYEQKDFGWKTRKANGVGKAIQSDFGQILGAGIMCCPKVSRTSFPWLPKECHSGGNMGSEFWSRRVELKEDSVIRKEGGDGLFKVKKVYSVLASPIVVEFPYSNVWVDKVPTKIVFFAWEAAWGKVLTLDRLQRRGWQFPNRCFLCGCEEETINHILIHCTVVKGLWDIILVLCGVQWVFPESVKESTCLFNHHDRKYTLERMFTSQLLESAKDELSFRTVVRDLRTKSPVLQIVLLNPNSWCCTGYCLGTEDTVDPVANINLYPAIKVLFSDCSYRTESQIR
ncbi:hypothetical protein CK203_006183 [Vitis vinifera]|uniref:Reverse transcriptase zinc-binding domain-containing protein n=1 Tax=Vitis vinifera TaxID=29760 RepID=A0A438K5V2_VITVI|nr:hypothetical protein CK203_006183 [Vitis vinifera]